MNSPATISCLQAGLFGRDSVPLQAIVHTPKCVSHTAPHNMLKMWSAAQVKPFILRRTKDKVLSDLPPKILQDVYIDPSPLQRLLYQDFAASHASHQVQGAIQSEGPTDAVADKAPHVFQVRSGTVPVQLPAVLTYAVLSMLSISIAHSSTSAAQTMPACLPVCNVPQQHQLCSTCKPDAWPS